MPLRLQELLTVASAFVVPSIVLLASVRTAAGFWDTGDLQTVAWIGGIPYPTGYPGYVVLSWIWAHLVPFGSIAARVNAISAIAVASAAATIAWTALTLRVLPIVAVAAAWTFAFAHVIWLRGTYADAHPLGFAVMLAAIAFGIRWTLRADARALGVGILLCGVAIAIDNTVILMLPGGLLIALARRWAPASASRAIAVAALIVLVAYAYLPLRSAYVTAHRLDPTLALGVPPGRPFWDDHHPASFDGFRSLVTGTEWSAGSILTRVLTPDAVRAAYSRFHAEFSADEPQGLAIAALIGIGLIAAEAPLVATGLIVAALVPALFGASYPAEADPERYVFMLYAVTAVGIAVASDRVIRAFARSSIGIPLLAAGILFALVIAHHVLRGQDIVAVRDDADASELAMRVASGTRDGAVVVAPWDWATPIAYHAYVDGAFGRRIVLCGFPRDYLDDYARWLPRRQVAFIYDGPPDVPGFRVRRLTGGVPQVYELLPR